MRLLIVILVIVGGGAGWLWWSQYHPGSPPGWQGYVEADYVSVGPVLQGQITAISVARGDAVKAGDPLFRQDDAAEFAARDQAARQLAQAEEQLANLKAGAKTTEIDQAEANLADAQSTLTRVELDLRRAETLLRSGNATAQSVDQLRAAYLSAQAKVQANRAALDQARSPMGRAAEIKGQEAAVAAAGAAVAMAQWRLDQRRVAAPAAGRVADVLAQPGETMAAGAPVVSILPPQNIFVRFFVPETTLSSLHRGDIVALSCDGCAAGLSGTISYIAPQAEYTPPVIYSEASRTKLVFRIEARPPLDQAARFNPGQPMEVRPIRQQGAE